MTGADRPRSSIPASPHRSFGVMLLRDTTEESKTDAREETDSTPAQTLA
jgi:hypothetical protein